MEYIYHYPSPLGEILLSGNDSSLTGLWFEGQKYYADTLTLPREERLTPVFEQTLDWLEIYFTGQDPAFLPPLSPRGTLRADQDLWGNRICHCRPARSAAYVGPGSGRCSRP